MDILIFPELEGGDEYRIGHSLRRMGVEGCIAGRFWWGWGGCIGLWVIWDEKGGGCWGVVF